MSVLESTRLLPEPARRRHKPRTGPRLAARDDQAGIREIAETLRNREPNVRSDCRPVLYEVGYLKPEPIISCSRFFVKRET